MNNFETGNKRQETRLRGNVSAQPGQTSLLISPDDLILITGAAGFIGSRVVEGFWSEGIAIWFVSPGPQAI